MWKTQSFFIDDADIFHYNKDIKKELKILFKNLYKSMIGWTSLPTTVNSCL